MSTSLNTKAIDLNQTSEIAVPNEERILVDRCILQDRLAQALLYKKHYGIMMSICIRYTRNRDEALETLNIGFLKVFNNLQRWEGVSLQGWIRRIITNTAIDQIRSRALYKEQPMPEDFDLPVSEELSSRLGANDLMKLVESLPTEQKIVFNLFAIEGYKHKEIAETLNISEGTSKWYVSEARKNLKLKLEKLYNV